MPFMAGRSRPEGTALAEATVRCRGGTRPGTNGHIQRDYQYGA